MINKKNDKNLKGLFFITTGLLLIAAAIFLTIYNLYDNRRAEESIEQVLLRLEAEISAEMLDRLPMETESFETDGAEENQTIESVETESIALSEETFAEVIIPDFILNPKMNMPEITVDGSNYIGILEIPSLTLEIPIMSNWNYDNLKTAPCRYSGSVYQKNLVICGHDYTSHFGKLKLLEDGDKVIFTDMDGNIFTYKLAVTEILQPTDIEEMESSGWSLTLFTCTVGGQSRLTLRFELVE